MSVIEEEPDEDSPEAEALGEGNKFEFDPDQYVPNMHLLEIDRK